MFKRERKREREKTEYAKAAYWKWLQRVKVLYFQTNIVSAIDVVMSQACVSEQNNYMKTFTMLRKQKTFSCKTAEKQKFFADRNFEQLRNWT